MKVNVKAHYNNHIHGRHIMIFKGITFPFWLEIFHLRRQKIWPVNLLQCNLFCLSLTHPKIMQPAISAYPLIFTYAFDGCHQILRHLYVCLYAREVKLTNICKLISTPRGQSSTAPTMRNAKQSFQPWNSLANCFFCPYLENFVITYPSVTP